MAKFEFTIQDALLPIPNSVSYRITSCDFSDILLLSQYNMTFFFNKPGSGRSPGEGNDKPLQYFFAWKTPWTEEPGGLQSTGWQESDML